MYITQRHKFSQHERLKGCKRVALLFKEGKKLTFYPIRLVYFRCEGQKKGSHKESHQVFFSIAKHRIKCAVERNKVKRVLRETYRLHKHILCESAQCNATSTHFLIAYVYIGGSQCDFITIREQLINALFYLKRSDSK